MSIDNLKEQFGVRSKKIDSEDDLFEEFPKVVDPGKDSQPNGDP
jgi:hypothetical protein